MSPGRGPGRGLARSERLTDPRAYERVFAKARRSRDCYFTVLARSGETDPARLGLAVSRRVDKRAVQRNRIKRLIRESFRHNKQAVAGLDLVVIARPAASGADNATLFAALAGHWARLGNPR